MDSEIQPLTTSYQTTRGHLITNRRWCRSRSLPEGTTSKSPAEYLSEVQQRETAVTEESPEWGPSLLETPGSLPGVAEPPGAHLHRAVWVHTHALTCAWRNATGLHRGTVRSGPVELILPVRMLLNMVFITLNSVCPCNEVPWEGVLLRRGRGKSYVFILWVLTHVTETIFLCQDASR